MKVASSAAFIFFPPLQIFMNKKILLIAFAATVVAFFCLSINGQTKSSEGKTVRKVITVVSKTAEFAGKAAVVTGKTLVVAAPPILKFSAQTLVVSGKAANFIVGKSMPVVRKLIVTYLKAKLPL